MSRSRALQFLRKTVESGKFGDSEIVEIIYDKKEGEDQFASDVVFVTVKLKIENRKENVDVVVKMQNESEIVRKAMNTDSQFYNETVVYDEILPFLNRNNVVKKLFPLFYHGYATDGERPLEDFVIIEDLRGLGFRLSEQRIYLDYDHAVLTLQRIGYFHALSYAAKQNDFENFIAKANRLKEVYYSVDRQGDFDYFRYCAERGISELSRNPRYKDILDTFSRKLQDTFTFMVSLIAPEEPIAVLCHGDFCRNNILYKYEENKPIEVKFFDLATARYSSPAFDISFFLLLNVPSDVRRERWDDLLGVYHESLSNSIPGTKVPTLEDIKTEMRRKAVYAYIVCSFFLPMMMTEEKLDLEEAYNSSEEQKYDMAMNSGGPKVTEVIATILEDLILNQCLNAL